MHELQVMEKILGVALDTARQNRVKKIISITVEIGALSDFQEIWMSKYFKTLASGTPAESAKLVIEKQKGFFICNACGNRKEMELASGDNFKCGKCGGELSFSGNGDYLVKNIEVI